MILTSMHRRKTTKHFPGCSAGASSSTRALGPDDDVADLEARVNSCITFNIPDDHDQYTFRRKIHLYLETTKEIDSLIALLEKLKGWRLERLSALEEEQDNQ